MDIAVFLFVLSVILITLAAFGVSLPWAHLGWLGVALAVFTMGVLPAFGHG